MILYYFEEESAHKKTLRSGLNKSILKKCNKIEFSQTTLNKDNVGKFNDANIIVIFASRISREIIDELPNLKYVISRSTGLDHIDLNECLQKEITVLNIPDYSTQAVAEYCLYMMLHLLRKISYLESGITSHSQLIGNNLSGKTIGIVGTGAIGGTLAKISNSLGLKVIVTNSSGSLPLKLSKIADYVKLEELLKRSDIISLNLPLVMKSKHLLSKNLNQIKNGSIIINSSRGAIVNLKYLIEELDNGRIAGFATDDMDKNTPSEIIDNLSQRPNVFISPHIAYNTFESASELVEKTINLLQKNFE